MNVQEILQAHPQWASVEKIYNRLDAHGYKAFLAGGCVRDALLGRVARDLDIATDALPQQIEDLFSKTVGVGKAFGVIRVLDYGADIEVATFRTDGEYTDGRRPEGVIFSSPEEDAQRRDFTINALFYDLKNDQVMDFVSGKADLQKRLIRTVGQPAERFGEDHLRILRAVRFTAQLGFVIESETAESIRQMANLVKTVSSERIAEELVKLLSSEYIEDGLQQMDELGLNKVLFPFREGNIKWPRPTGTLSADENLALYFVPCSLESLTEELTSLKLSSRTQRFVTKASELLKNPDSFFNMSVGAQLAKLSEEGLRFALRCLAEGVFATTEGRAEKSQELLEKWNSWGQSLPPRWVGGEDLKKEIQGPRLGEALQDVYERQLEDQFKNKAEALEWVTKKYL